MAQAAHANALVPPGKALEKPASHGVQAVAPALLHDPGEHSVQVDAPLELKLPAAHMVQAEALVAPVAALA